jgi:DNA-binding transcriptional regulator YiaG
VRKVGTAARIPAKQASETRIRFVAKGLVSQRKRLGLSASHFGELAGVSGQSIYNWERGTTYPRTEQLAQLVALRGVGKREAQARLEQGKAKQTKRARQT